MVATRVRLWVWGCATLLAALAATVGVLHLHDNRDRVRGEAREELQRFIQSAEGVLNRNLLQADLVLAAQATEMAQTAKAGAIDAAAAGARMRSTTDQHVLLRDMALLDEKGQVIAAAREATSRLGVVLPEGFLPGVLALGFPTLRVSAPTLNPATSERTVWLARPVSLPRQRAAIVAEIPVTSLTSLLGSTAGRDAWTMTVEHADGTVLGTVPYREPILGTRLAHPLAAAQADGMARVAPGRLDQQASLVVSRPGLYPELLISMGVPLAALDREAQTNLTDYARATAALVLLLVVLAGVLDWHLHQQARDRRELEAAQQHLRSSHEQLQQQVRERERADTERANTQAVMSGLLQHTMEGFWHIDAETRTIDVNPAMCALLGRPREDIVGRSIFDFVDETNAAVFRRQIDLRREGRGGSYEISLQRPDGSLVACINNATPIFDEQGVRTSSVGLWTDVSSMVAAQRELVTAKATLDRALDSMIEGFVLYDSNERLVSVNTRYFELFPHLKEVLRPGAHWRDALEAMAHYHRPGGSEAERAAWIAERRTYARDGRPSEQVQPDGRIIEITERVTPDGGFVDVARDVTAQRQAQHDLAAAKSTLDRALDAMAEGFLLFDRDDRLLMWNQHYIELFPHLGPLLHRGMPITALHEASARHLLPLATSERRQAWIAERARHHRGGGAPLEVVQPDGRVVEIVESETPDGGFVAVFRDVSAAHRAQRELAAAKSTLDQALDAMSDGFVIFDENARLLVWNQRYVELWPYLRGHIAVGMTHDEVSDIAAQALFPDSPAQREEFKARRLAERQRGAGKSEVVTYGGRSVQANDRRTSDGKLVSLFRDVTQENDAARAMAQARDAAAAAANAKSRFLAAMSHEIRTPLNAVLGMNGLLMETALDAEQRRHVDLIAKSGESLLAIINDILDLSRLEAGKLALEVVDFSLVAAVHDVISMMTVRAQAKALTLALHVQPGAEALVVRGDPSRLRQVLFNLVGNAVKFTEKGRIDVDLGHDVSPDGKVAVSLVVRDTGIGIEPQSLPDLFERFQQADSSTSRRFGGSGLGLAICREIVVLMGGSIKVDSEPGRGSTFRVDLALERAQGTPEPAGVDKTTDAPVASRPLRVLVAEDNSVNQILIGALLTRLGHHHDIVADGFEALRQVQAAPYDVVLMDMQMPQMDGIEATRAIRALGSTVSQVSIIAMTANVMAEDRAACIGAGMNGFVGKPINQSLLNEAIELAVNQRWPPQA